MKISANKLSLADEGVPLYMAVASRLRDRIYGGLLAPGQRLETEAKLAAEFGVGRATIRGALDVLQREGLIVKQQGLPSFVRSRRVQQSSARLATLEKTLEEQGFAATTRVLAFAFQKPSDQVRAALDLRADEDVLYIQRLHLVEDGPIAIVELCVPADRAGELSRKEVEAHALYELLPSQLGIGIGSAVQRVRAEPASADVAQWLGVAEGFPLLKCERITYGEDGLPLIHALFQHAGDRFEFVVELPSHGVHQVWAFPGLTLTRPQPESEEGHVASR